jgi:hypothetical protein
MTSEATTPGLFEQGASQTITDARNAEPSPLGDMASASDAALAASGTADSTDRRLSPLRYQILSSSTVPLKAKASARTYRRAETATLALLRMSLGRDRSYDWFANFGRKRMSWSQWRAAGYPEDRTTLTYSREPPLPGWKTLDKNQCPVCGQPTFAGGAWWPEAGPPRFNKQWHEACALTHQTWRHPDFLAQTLAIKQGGVCPETGDRVLIDRPFVKFPYDADPAKRMIVEVRQVLAPGVEVDHRLPLWRVRREAHLYQWPEVLKFWGPGNLQALSNAGHKAKTAREARERAGRV